MTKLTIGQTNLKASDIIDIINACGENNVSLFEIGDMSIELNPNVNKKLYPTELFDYNNSDNEKEIKVAGTKNELNLEELRLSDPLAYEEYLLDGE